jgi:unsaturated rhamnogalacturonyl hydrolase
VKVPVGFAVRFVALAWSLVACGESANSIPSPGGAGSGGDASGGTGVVSSSGSNAGGQLVAGAVSNIGGAPNAGAAGVSTAGSVGLGGAGAAGIGGAAAGAAGDGGQTSITYPPAAQVLEVLARVNQQFADKWPDPSAPIVVGGTSRPSNIWTRAVYYEGLLNLYAVDAKPAYKDYALAWGNAHSWQLRNNDSTTTNADNQCAGQAYIDLYNLDGGRDAQRIAAIQTSIDAMVSKKVSNVWTWIDAIQMSMPVLVRFGVLRPTGGYLDAAYALYSHPKKALALYNTTDHLWWRDTPWKGQKTPAGKQVYWSRGNGWVFAALVRTLDLLPATDAHRAEYTQDFKDMAAALRSIQRDDGFWNPSLGDPTHFGGPESSGTGLFLYGMAWGVRTGMLDEATYAPVIIKAWNALEKTAVQANGFVGYMQSTGDDPADGQPLTNTKQPDFEDYGVGCVLLGGSELAKLSAR